MSIPWLIIAISIAAVAVALVAVLWQLFGILGRFKNEVTPILKSVEFTLDEINKDLAKVDDIIKAGEEVVEKVNATTKIAQEAISSPLIKVVSFSAGLKKALSSFKKRS